MTKARMAQRLLPECSTWPSNASWSKGTMDLDSKSLKISRTTNDPLHPTLPPQTPHPRRGRNRTRAQRLQRDRSHEPGDPREGPDHRTAVRDRRDPARVYRSIDRIAMNCCDTDGHIAALRLLFRIALRFRLTRLRDWAQETKRAAIERRHGHGRCAGW